MVDYNSLSLSSIYDCVILVYYIEFCFFFFFKQKTAYDIRISDWSSDVCSSDLHRDVRAAGSGGPERHDDAVFAGSRQRRGRRPAAGGARGSRWRVQSRRRRHAQSAADRRPARQAVSAAAAGGAEGRPVAVKPAESDKARAPAREDQPVPAGGGKQEGERRTQTS